MRPYANREMELLAVRNEGDNTVFNDAWLIKMLERFEIGDDLIIKIDLSNSIITDIGLKRLLTYLQKPTTRKLPEDPVGKPEKRITETKVRPAVRILKIANLNNLDLKLIVELLKIIAPTVETVEIDTVTFNAESTLRDKNNNPILFPNLVEFRINNCTIEPTTEPSQTTNIVVKQLVIPIISKAPELITLSLRGSLDSEISQADAELFARCPKKLVAVYLLSNNNIARLVASLPKNLATLFLDNMNPETTKAVIPILMNGNFTCLTHLSLSNNSVGIEQLGALLEKLPKIKTLKLRKMIGITTENDLKKLLTFITTLTELTSLDLSENDLRKIFPSFINFIKGNEKLIEIALSNCRLGSIDVCDFVDALLTTCHSHIENIDWSHNDSGPCQNLKDEKGNQIGENIAATFWGVLIKQSKTVQRLDLSHNKIGEEGGKLIYSGFHESARKTNIPEIKEEEKLVKITAGCTISVMKLGGNNALSNDLLKDIQRVCEVGEKIALYNRGCAVLDTLKGSELYGIFRLHLSKRWGEINKIFTAKEDTAGLQSTPSVYPAPSGSSRGSQKGIRPRATVPTRIPVDLNRLLSSLKNVSIIGLPSDCNNQVLPSNNVPAQKIAEMLGHLDGLICREFEFTSATSLKEKDDRLAEANALIGLLKGTQEQATADLQEKIEQLIKQLEAASKDNDYSKIKVEKQIKEHCERHFEPVGSLFADDIGFEIKPDAIFHLSFSSQEETHICILKVAQPCLKKLDKHPLTRNSTINKDGSLPKGWEEKIRYFFQSNTAPVDLKTPFDFNKAHATVKAGLDLTWINLYDEDALNVLGVYLSAQLEKIKLNSSSGKLDLQLNAESLGSTIRDIKAKIEKIRDVKKWHGLKIQPTPDMPARATTSAVFLAPDNPSDQDLVEALNAFYSFTDRLKLAVHCHSTASAWQMPETIDAKILIEFQKTVTKKDFESFKNQIASSMRLYCIQHRHFNIPQNDALFEFYKLLSDFLDKTEYSDLLGNTLESLERCKEFYLLLSATKTQHAAICANKDGKFLTRPTMGIDKASFSGSEAAITEKFKAITQLIQAVYRPDPGQISDFEAAHNLFFGNANRPSHRARLTATNTRLFFMTEGDGLYVDLRNAILPHVNFDTSLPITTDEKRFIGEAQETHNIQIIIINSDGTLSAPDKNAGTNLRFVFVRKNRDGKYKSLFVKSGERDNADAIAQRVLAGTTDDSDKNKISEGNTITSTTYFAKVTDENTGGVWIFETAEEYLDAQARNLIPTKLDIQNDAHGSTKIAVSRNEAFYDNVKKLKKINAAVDTEKQNAAAPAVPEIEKPKCGVVIALDQSGSMTGANWNTAIELISRYLKKIQGDIHKDSPISIILFGDLDPHRNPPLTGTLEEMLKTHLVRLRKYQPEGMTPPHLMRQQLELVLKDSKFTNVKSVDLICFTDGDLTFEKPKQTTRDLYTTDLAAGVRLYNNDTTLHQNDLGAVFTSLQVRLLEHTMGKSIPNTTYVRVGNQGVKPQDAMRTTTMVNVADHKEETIESAVCALAGNTVNPLEPSITLGCLQDTLPMGSAQGTFAKIKAGKQNSQIFVPPGTSPVTRTVPTASVRELASRATTEVSKNNFCTDEESKLALWKKYVGPFTLSEMQLWYCGQKPIIDRFLKENIKIMGLSFQEVQNAVAEVRRAVLRLWSLVMPTLQTDDKPNEPENSDAPASGNGDYSNSSNNNEKPGLLVVAGGQRGGQRGGGSGYLRNPSIQPRSYYEEQQELQRHSGSTGNPSLIVDGRNNRGAGDVAGIHGAGDGFSDKQRIEAHFLAWWEMHDNGRSEKISYSKEFDNWLRLYTEYTQYQPGSVPTQLEQLMTESSTRLDATHQELIHIKSGVDCAWNLFIGSIQSPQDQISLKQQYLLLQYHHQVAIWKNSFKQCKQELLNCPAGSSARLDAMHQELIRIKSWVDYTWGQLGSISQEDQNSLTQQHQLLQLSQYHLQVAIWKNSFNQCEQELLNWSELYTQYQPGFARQDWLIQMSQSIAGLKYAWSHFQNAISQLNHILNLLTPEQKTQISQEWNNLCNNLKCIQNEKQQQEQKEQILLTQQHQLLQLSQYHHQVAIWKNSFNQCEQELLNWSELYTQYQPGFTQQEPIQLNEKLNSAWLSFQNETYQLNHIFNLLAPEQKTQISQEWNNLCQKWNNLCNAQQRISQSHTQPLSGNPQAIFGLKGGATPPEQQGGSAYSAPPPPGV